MAWSRPGLGTKGVGGIVAGLVLRRGVKDQTWRSNAPHSTRSRLLETYEHDVVIRLSGEVVKRKKKLSKKRSLSSRGGRAAHCWLGPNGQCALEAEAYFAKKGCKVLLQPTPQAIREFNRSHEKKIGLFHVTC